MTELPIFLINLDGSDDRLANASAALAQHGARFNRISAFDGRGKSVETIPEYTSAGAQRFLGRDLTGGEIGCFISHVEAAKAFLKTGAAFGLVLEDDMFPEPYGIAKTKTLVAANEQPDWHLAHLCAENLKIATPTRTNADGTQILRAHYFPMRTTALLWSRAGAAAFVQACYPITCPIDIHLRHWLMQDDRGIAVHPRFFSIAASESEIDGANTNAKRGGSSRSASYTFKRLRRMIREKRRAKFLQRQTGKGIAR